MLLTLRFLHQVGAIGFGGLLFYQFLLFVLVRNKTPNLEIIVKIFYIFILPFFLLLVISGILLIVQRSYKFKYEKWLQQKFISAVVIMFLLTLGISPEIRNFTDSISSSKYSYSTDLSLKLILLTILVFALFIRNLSLALQHRIKLDN